MPLTNPWLAGAGGRRRPGRRRQRPHHARRVGHAWREELFADTTRPPAQVPALAGWLADRLDEALVRFQAIGDCAAELRALASGMRAALGEVPERPELMTGVPCARCDMRSQIWRWPDGWRECAGEYGCGRLYSDQEWREWLAGDVVGQLIAAHRPV